VWNGGGDTPSPILKATIHLQRSNFSSTKVCICIFIGIFQNVTSILTNLFPKGYAFGPHDPSLPEFWVAINGFFPNGTQFASTLPATSGDVTTSGQEVTGIWDGAGGFKGSADFSTFTVTFNASSAGFVGTVELRSNAVHHFGCNSTTDPYFSSAIPSGTKLSDAESLLYTQLGWATTEPGKYHCGDSLL
jgi:hypothetical protein